MTARSGPNLKPALQAPQATGFTRLRVLILPYYFGTDWVQNGYPAVGGTEERLAWEAVLIEASPGETGESQAQR